MLPHEVWDLRWYLPVIVSSALFCFSGIIKSWTLRALNIANTFTVVVVFCDGSAATTAIEKYTLHQ